jgi:membrane protein
MPRAKLTEIHVWPLLKRTAFEWSEDKATKMAASLAYYTATSIAPLVVAVLGIAALVARNKITPQRLHDELQQLTSKDVADVLNSIIFNAKTGHNGLLATLFGIIVAIISASSLFGELQDSLNTIWEVKPKPNRGIMGIIHDRFLTMTMVLGIAFLLLVSTVLTSVITGLSGAFFGGLFGNLSSDLTKDIVMAITILITTGIVTVLFAAIFKLLPDVIVSWRDVWLGGFLTAVLFEVGKWGLSEYIGRAAPGSAFGTLGAIVVMLIWVYYSAQILFFGAEFTQVYANQYGSHVVPAANAEPLTEDMRRQAGMPHAPDSASHPDRKPAPPARPPRRRPVPPALPVARPATPKSGAVLLAAAPVAVGVVLGRFAFLRYKAAHVHADEIGSGWRAAAQQWKKLGRLFVSKSADRFVMTHGPGGTAGPSWSDLADPAHRS